MSVQVCHEQWIYLENEFYQNGHYFISTIIFSCRFPQLFPPLKPEVVAQRTVDAVRADKAFLYLPWTMHALVILKR